MPKALHILHPICSHLVGIHIRKKKSMSTWLIYVVEYDWWLFVEGWGTGSHKTSGVSHSALLLQIMMNVQLPTCVWMGCALMKMVASSASANQDLSWLQMGVTVLVCIWLWDRKVTMIETIFFIWMNHERITLVSSCGFHIIHISC